MTEETQQTQDNSQPIHNATRSHDESRTSHESAQSEPLLPLNTTEQIEEGKQHNFNLDRPNQDAAPSNISRPQTRPVTPPASVDWEQTTSNIPEFDFDSTSTGVQFHIDENTSVLEVFKCLFPSDTVQQLVQCTNNYGRVLCNKNRPMTRNSQRYNKF